MNLIKFKLHKMLIKAVLMGALVSLTACMTPPKMKPIPKDLQPEFLYTQNLWTHHQPYDIRRRLAPVISGIQSASYSLDQSINSAYTVQAEYISAENKRLMRGYQYQNTLYNQKLEAERNKNLARIKEFEQKNRHANITPSSYKASDTSWYDENHSLKSLFDPKNGLFIEASKAIIQPGKDAGSSMRFHNCRSSNKERAPEFQEDCHR